MTAVRDMELWRQLRSPAALVLLVTLGFSLVPASEQPSLVVRLGSSSASIVPADVALLVLLAVAVALLVRRGVPLEARAVVVGGAAFCALVVLTAAANGTTALVAGVKTAELAVLALGAIAVLRSRRAFEAVVDVLLLFTLVADVWGIEEYIRAGGRQAAWLGIHDLAALGTLPFVYGLALVHERRNGRRAALAMVAGGLACVLGAALATLLGIWLAAAALLVSALARRRLDRRLVAVTVLSVALVTAGTAEQRSGAFGFLQAIAGQKQTQAGEFAGSWSQRLLYTYIDGRVFLDQPLLGTGWYGLLPPSEFARYVPDARRRFPDQPASYFPRTDSGYIPQQTFDQVPAQLGVVGSVE